MQVDSDAFCWHRPSYNTLRRRSISGVTLAGTKSCCCCGCAIWLCRLTEPCRISVRSAAVSFTMQTGPWMTNGSLPRGAVTLPCKSRSINWVGSNLLTLHKHTFWLGSLASLGMYSHNSSGSNVVHYKSVLQRVLQPAGTGTMYYNSSSTSMAQRRFNGTVVTCRCCSTIQKQQQHMEAKSKA